MMKKVYLYNNCWLKSTFLFLALFGIQQMQSQDIYCFYQVFPFFDQPAEIYTLSPSGVLTFVTQIADDLEEARDIAMTSNGQLYTVSSSGSIGSISLDTGTINELTSLPSSNTYTSLTSNGENKLYILNFNHILYSYDLELDTIINLGNIGDGSPGDLTFYHGALVFPSSEDNTIKAYDLNSNTLSTIFCLPDEFLFPTQIWGITNLFDECGTEQLIISSTGLNDYFKIDFENQEVIPIEVSFTSPPPGGQSTLGITSKDEGLAAFCPVDISDFSCFTAVDENLATPQKRTIFPNPASEEINIPTAEESKKIQIFNLVGTLVLEAKPSYPYTFLSIQHLPKGSYFVKNGGSVYPFIKN